MQINELIDTKIIEFSEKPLILDKVARKIILSHFKGIKEGEITLIENSEHIIFGQTTPNYRRALQCSWSDDLRVNCLVYWTNSGEKTRLYCRSLLVTLEEAGHSWMPKVYTC